MPPVDAGRSTRAEHLGAADPLPSTSGMRPGGSEQTVSFRALNNHFTGKCRTAA
jgi:hypothetical protein